MDKRGRKQAWPEGGGEQQCRSSKTLAHPVGSPAMCVTHYTCLRDLKRLDVKAQ